MQKDIENFNMALNLCEKNLSHDDLFEMLKCGNVIERQYAALNLYKINDANEAEILLSNLVNVDGKIREVVALKLVEFTKIFSTFFENSNLYEKFVQATIDIDGNVCRCAISSAYNLANNKEFAKYYTESMIKIINNSLNELAKFTFRDKKYKLNKQNFKIYWALEALICFYNKVDLVLLKEILLKCSVLNEYTIREKCAKLLIHFDKSEDEELREIRYRLINDENYYVRSVFE